MSDPESDFFALFTFEEIARFNFCSEVSVVIVWNFSILFRSCKNLSTFVFRCLWCVQVIAEIVYTLDVTDLIDSIGCSGFGLSVAVEVLGGGRISWTRRKTSRVVSPSVFERSTRMTISLASREGGALPVSRIGSQ